MELNKARELALKLMDQHGLYPRWQFRFGKHRTKFGECSETLDLRPSFCHIDGTIALSKVLTEINDEEVVRDVILHEIAHALVGCHHGHDNVWRAKALEIGCNGETYYSYEKTNVIGIQDTMMIGNRLLKKGDEIIIDNGFKRHVATFFGYKSSNRIYPVLIELRNGRKMKCAKRDVIFPVQSQSPSTFKKKASNDPAKPIVDHCPHCTNPKSDNIGRFKVTWQRENVLGTVNYHTGDNMAKIVKIHKDGRKWNIFADGFHVLLMGVVPDELEDGIELALEEVESQKILEH